MIYLQKIYMNNYEKIVNRLIDNKETVSLMESCTGGSVTSEITNVDLSSKVIKFSAITYSNLFKEKFNVSKSIIDKYTVYSKEVAIEMAKQICLYSSSSYGIGITGRLLKDDYDNMGGDNNVVYISIYDYKNDKYLNNSVTVCGSNKKECKEYIIKFIGIIFLNYLNKEISYDMNPKSWRV